MTTAPFRAFAAQWGDAGQTAQVSNPTSPAPSTHRRRLPRLSRLAGLALAIAAGVSLAHWLWTEGGRERRR